MALGLLGAMARQVLSKEAMADDLVSLAPGAVGETPPGARDHARVDGPPVVPPITQADLASLCGVTRESVSKTLTSFDRRGLVRREGRTYVLLDTAALTRLAGG